jgi:aminodeoxyfutalosine synthase
MPPRGRVVADRPHRRRDLPRADPRLEPIRAKVERGERLSLDDGMTLYETPDLWGVFELANLVRERLHPGVGYYNINRHLNYSNVCALSCKFCEFYRKKGDDGAYTHDIDSIAEEAKQGVRERRDRDAHRGRAAARTCRGTTTRR